MLSKIYIGLLAVSVAIVGFFTYYSWSWLQSIGVPAAAVEGFVYHSGTAWYVLWVSFALLLAVGNGILWSSRSSWAMWASFIYLAAFLLIRYFWLDGAAFRFKTAAGLGEGSFSLGPLLGALVIVAAGMVVLAEHFIVVRLYRKFFPEPSPAETLPDEKPEGVN